ncbi:DUF3299 domain-containing protein [Endozoicomonas sp. SM1973]|uniref:DUF3299 domain-containing protein n=1 Tax=Spartinivicinus marinus TaxID=2994442 RepID=A0A853IFW1_9GAMM|nr:DUF3299 domain-containing protein [Spartinivicinus marinus]MCX4028703.1 DUF3299 domain-containing protein [Spartinivicinus marinus]NYZ68035.1 DUF3299 domain-containing protein [Spartinivicinus marinus]
MAKLNVKAALMSAVLLFSPALTQADVKTLQWEDLVPEDMRKAFLEEQAPKDINALAEALTKQAKEKTKGTASAPVVVALDKKEVKLPGYIVPLDMKDDGSITEFLLVPYFGACVHVPPPPPNQVVHVIHEKGLNPDALYDPFWVTGTLSITGIETELAQAGYTMKAKQVELYTEPAEEEQPPASKEQQDKPKKQGSQSQDQTEPAEQKNSTTSEKPSSDKKAG